MTNHTPPKKGLLIYFEGIGGSGKTTAIRAATEYLESLGYDVVQTKEPGGGQAFGVIVRNMLLQGSLAPVTDLFLFMADRVEHRSTIITPAMMAGKIVLCDRGPASTVAYQHGLKGIPLTWIAALQSVVDKSHPTSPSVKIWLDCPVEVAIKRTTGRGGQSDKFDTADIAAQQLIIDSYDDQFDGDLDWYRIDADNSEHKVVAEVISVLDEVLK